MTQKDYIAIIDSVLRTPRVKAATKKAVLLELSFVFATDNPKNFDIDKYWAYINARMDF